MNIKNIKIKDYSYSLPKNRIAKYPIEKRDESKLLIYQNKLIKDDVFKNITSYLPENHLLVMNNTKVIYARLIFKKITGAKIEIFCLNPFEPSEYNLSFASKKTTTWECIVGNLKKWKHDDLELKFGKEKEYTLRAKKIETKDHNQIIKFEWNANITFSEVLEHIGKIPIPPYLDRDSEETDKQRYQTVYSRVEGSVAAPTAGLHFTDKLLEKLQNKKNINTAEVTLHVGAGTFKPVKSETIDEHEMHSEIFYITIDELKKIHNNLGKIISVGTTSMRTLESLYFLGINIINKRKNFNEISQWQPYEEKSNIPAKEAIGSIIEYLEKHNTDYLKGKTQIMIVPGYDFKITDILITNFHQPQSTLLLLVAAFVGDDWKKIYDYALKNDFRFLSYGDSSLLFKNNSK